MKNKKGITLISLVITIVVLIILLAVAIYLTLGNNGILNKAEQAKNETIKQTATEKMNLKITNIQIEKYAEEQRMPTLQEFADGLCEDNEIQYVQLQSKKVGSLNKIEVGQANSIFTKLKEYPYEFEVNSSLQLSSIDGIQVATSNTVTIPKDEYDKLKNTNTYSTEEKVIGTWIDGKPLYRKVVKTSISNIISANVWTTIATDNDLFAVESVVDMTAIRVSAKRIEYEATMAIKENQIKAYTDVDYFKPEYIIVEYTKTTDSAS